MACGLCRSVWCTDRVPVPRLEKSGLGPFHKFHRSIDRVRGAQYLGVFRITGNRPQSEVAVTWKRGKMKVIVADKISERGVEFLKQAGWNVVQTTKETLGGELADAEAVIVRRAKRGTPDLRDRAPRLGGVGGGGVGVDNIDLE